MKSYFQHSNSVLGLPLTAFSFNQTKDLIEELAAREGAPRYLHDFMGIVARLPLEVAARFVLHPYKGPTTTSSMRNANSLHLHIAGSIDADLAPVINWAIEDCIAEARILSIHLRMVKQMDASGIRLLLDARRRLVDAGLSIQSTGSSLRLRLLINTCSTSPLRDESKARTVSIADKEMA